MIDFEIGYTTYI